jgi:glycerate kinase
MNILIAPDKFKGTLDAAGVARALARGWRAARPQDRLRLLPMSDGGDGFGPVISAALGGRSRSVRTVDAAGHSCRPRWWYAAALRTAVIETARVVGLAMLPPGEHHPFGLDTFGVGQMLLAARAAGARRCLVGIGGSATNDGGFGLARALGWQFLDSQRKPILRWPELTHLRRVQPPSTPAPLPQIEVAVDVQNPLLGRLGATRVYGPQKGLRPADFTLAEAALRQLARVLATATGNDLHRLPGAGAAGGLGFGLAAFAGARLVAGFEVFRGLVGLDAHLRWADVVVTGEGRFDASSAMGKGVGCLVDLALAQSRKCLVFAGEAAPDRRRRLAACRGLTEVATVAEAMRDPARWLNLLVRDTVAGLKLA